MIQEIVISNFKGIKYADIKCHKGVNIIVGNNGVGKSTILEAINLALGIGLNQFEVTQHVFHSSSIHAFTSHKLLPESYIELYFEETITSSEYSGANNHLRKNVPGIRLTIACDSDYRTEFECNKEEYKHIPCEYYRIERSWFSDTPVKQFLVPYTTCVIDSSSSHFNNRASNLATRIIEEELSSSELVQVKGCLRELKELFEGNEKVKSVNGTLNSKTADIQDLKLSVDLTTRVAWNTILSPMYKDIPFSQIGLGDQCIVKTLLSIGKKQPKKERIMIIEEPESHLSHTKMYELMNHLCHFDGQLFVTTHNSFVANKLDLKNLIVIDNIEGEVNPTIFDTNERGGRFEYFTKAPNFPTLRIALCKKAILVEGPTDEMILLYYFRKKYNLHPFGMGIELIVIGGNKMFPRFTELANAIGKSVAVITDNDNDEESIVRQRVNPDSYSNVKVFTEPNRHLHTIEPSFVASNSDKLQELSEYIRTSTVENDSQEDLAKYMEKHKTEWSYKVLTTDNTTFNVPKYIEDAVDWIINQ